MGLFGGTTSGGSGVPYTGATADVDLGSHSLTVAPDEDFGNWTGKLSVPTKDTVWTLVLSLSDSIGGGDASTLASANTYTDSQIAAIPPDVPYTGATQDLDLGSWRVLAGQAVLGVVYGSDDAPLSILAGYSVTPDIDGQAITLTASDASGANFNGGYVELVGGHGGGGTGKGGDAKLTGGDAIFMGASDGDGGDAVLKGGAGAGTGKNGSVVVDGDKVRITTAKTPSSATDAGTAGDVCWDSSYMYVCVATDTWKRSALSTW